MLLCVERDGLEEAMKAMEEGREKFELLQAQRKENESKLKNLNDRVAEITKVYEELEVVRTKNAELRHKLQILADHIREERDKKQKEEEARKKSETKARDKVNAAEEPSNEEKSISESAEKGQDKSSQNEEADKDNEKTEIA